MTVRIQGIDHRRQSDLVKVIQAGRVSSRFLGAAESRQQQSSQHRDDRNDNEEFDQCERQPLVTRKTAWTPVKLISHGSEPIGFSKCYAGDFEKQVRFSRLNGSPQVQVASTAELRQCPTAESAC